MTAYRDELIWAYNGEVLGEAMFATMAEAVSDPARAGQLAVMALIERQTKEQLARLLERERFEPDDSKAIAKGQELGVRSARADWGRFLGSFAPATGPALERYKVMRDELSPAEDRPTMDALVLHEQVVQAFADLALAGDANPAGPTLEALDGANQAVARLLLRQAP
ncbi:MAG: hypothetical protein ACKVWR_00695 [Acidimicrobiales bacterium]